MSVDYTNEDITERAQESQLWQELERQKGKALPYLLERYLLLSNWQYRNKRNLSMDHGDRASYDDDFSYVHLLLAEAVTVMLGQEERIRKLEEFVKASFD
jgi:hypothetical protein